MFAFLHPTKLDTALALARLLHIEQKPQPLMFTDKLVLPVANWTNPPCRYGHGTVIHDNNFKVIGVGTGSIEEPHKIAKQLKLMVAVAESLFLLPALFARARYDVLVFRDLLQQHIDGNFTALMYYRQNDTNCTLVVTTAGVCTSLYEREEIICTERFTLGMMNDVQEIRPYSMCVTKGDHYRTWVNWRVPSKRPLYIVYTEEQLNAALKHARVYLKDDVAFFAQGVLADNIAQEGHAVINGLNQLPVDRPRLLMSSATIAFRAGYDAVVAPEIIPRHMLRHMTDAFCLNGMRKQFSILDPETHVLS